MRLTRIEWVVIRLLLRSDMPMSITELAEQSNCRFAPLVIITLAVESLLKKKMIVEAGVHKSLLLGKEQSHRLFSLADMNRDA